MASRMMIPRPIITQPIILPGLRPLRIIKHRPIHRINTILCTGAVKCYSLFVFSLLRSQSLKLAVSS